jgi:putative endonuclease
VSKRSVNLGKLGEQKAAEHLRSQGYKILERNFRTRLGEIDIIVQDKTCLIFVEVKTRWSQKYGQPEESVTAKKIKTIIKVGQYYKMLHPKTPNLMRIDVIAIELDSSGRFRELRHLKNVI